MATNRSNPVRAALAAAVGELRRGLAADRPIDLGALRSIADAIATAPRLQHAGGTDVAHLALLDELDLLVGELALEHAALAAQLRAATRHRRAGSAYGSRSVG